jgi:polysaccharide deacetylase family protein (PEP-CTERM system associated)
MRSQLFPENECQHILSVDVEDYFQVEAFADRIPRTSWNQYPCRVVDNCHRLLDIFDRHQAKASFFTLGWVADRFPSLVWEIKERGHELACHSFWHRRVDTLTPAEFRDDTREACDAIEQAASVRVIGYRAPTWSFTRKTLWALDILADEGIEYDSSIYPIRHDLYGIPGASRFPYGHVSSNGSRLIEFPPTTIRLGRMNLPAAGGGYLRIFPLFYTCWAFRQCESVGLPAVLYLHPWEVDPDQPRIQGSLRSEFRHYTNLDRTLDRLEYLLTRYRFGPVRDQIPRHRHQWAQATGASPESSVSILSRCG